ncbi:MAG: hypothetical protein FWC62_06460 [Firmicutes bacterium]|nr:hypothetical protein [Bacillota bacterium]
MKRIKVWSIISLIILAAIIAVCAFGLFNLGTWPRIIVAVVGVVIMIAGSFIIGVMNKNRKR